MESVSILAIELGDFTAGALGDVLWFLVGVLMLSGLTALIIRHNRRSSPDPFE